ncbi:hypothetical protein J0X19_07260 [Hymenobacter sp. BT186]|uniref:Uncharacterized protein n=1 Tax=Hymenobacter telluris TaxID=2816474 RepID=A0A939EV65_9BACT|nr:hypothetical protein [Hymenobacter telluris]MBO0357739.1 hypothetical protein [Hymenobacter telluris]MBW3373766.1 hypothetical protein [Hymenobacter norwichensis]
MPFTAAATLRPSARIRLVEWLVVGLLTVLCLLLPTHNSTPDAWYYAACVRHGHELLQPHHLLYNAVGWLWWHLLLAQVDALTALKALNALAFGGCLLVLRNLLRRVAGPAAPVAGWLLVVGSSFGMLRFATENETYIVPLLLSLLASRSWWRAVTEGGSASWLAAGSWATGAALFHQIHAGWWLALLVGTVLGGGKSWWHKALLYVLPALLVPVAYAAALPSWNLPFTFSAFWRFVFHDLYAGHAGASPSGHTLLLTSVNLVRTLGQLHGSTLALLQRWPGLGGLALVSVGLMGWGAFRWWQARQNAVNTRYVAPAVRETTDAQRLFQRTHWLVLLLQLACAVWAEGNAEFMVMMPALLALLLIKQPMLRAALPWAGASLLVWNLTFGLLPAHLLRFTNTTSLLTRIEREPAAWWLLSDPNLVLNQLHYRTGQLIGPANILPAPALLVRRPGQSPAGFRAWLAARRAAGQPVYTDALGGPRLLDRARLTQGSDEAQLPLLTGYHLARIDSFATSFGPVYVTEIQ